MTLMGTMTFLLPPGLPADAVQELARASVAGGPDSMPYPTQVTVEEDRLVVRRNMDESGYLLLPWNVEGLGRLMASSPTLIERAQPYQVQVELARGKVNQLRNQAADWLAGGLQMPDALAQDIRTATLAFTRAVTQLPTPQAGPDAQIAIARAFAASTGLVDVYVNQVFEVRHQRQPRLDTGLACRLGLKVPGAELTAGLKETFNTVCLPLSWNEVQPAETDFRWPAHDAVLDWAVAAGFRVVGGPLIDFSPSRLPDWLWLWERDLPSLAGFLCQYVEAAIRRYRGRIRSWQLTAASNAAEVLSLSEDELLWLTVRLAEAARQVEPGLELSVGIAQPWGEYMCVQDRSHSPFIFADTLIRSGVNLAGLDLELVMGVGPRGSYCRDLLEMSRLLDLYALLGVPLQVTLGYPSSDGPDPRADAEMTIGAGFWEGGFTPDVQAGWAASVGALTVCKPSVRGVTWAHLFDGDSHQFPACGLVDSEGNVKPAMARLHELRQKHLR
jgi:hypothetical protein